MIHVVDMYPNLAGLAGAQLGKNKQLDGLNVWPAISEGKPSPRDEVVYNIEPFRGAVRKGDWKLVWQALLPPRMELFDISHDTSETTNLAETNPEKVKELQTRIEGLAREAVPPLFFADVMRIAIGAPPSTPDMYFINPDFRNGPSGVKSPSDHLVAGFMLPSVVGALSATSCHQNGIGEPI